MKKPIKTIFMTFIVVLAFDVTLSGKVKSDKAQYVGGTVNSIPQLAEGAISTSDDKIFVFEYSGGKLSIPYDRVNSLEYGQKAGRRVGVAIVVTPLALFSKKRKHFLTIGYQDENDKQQAAVFQLGKNTVRVTLTTLEARTGRKIEYQDEEARKSGLGN